VVGAVRPTRERPSGRCKLPRNTEYRDLSLFSLSLAFQRGTTKRGYAASAKEADTVRLIAIKQAHYRNEDAARSVGSLDPGFAEDPELLETIFCERRLASFRERAQSEDLALIERWRESVCRGEIAQIARMRRTKGSPPVSMSSSMISSAETRDRHVRLKVRKQPAPLRRSSGEYHRYSWESVQERRASKLRGTATSYRDATAFIMNSRRI